MNTKKAARIIAKEMAQVRKDRVSCIREQLQSGQYRISSSIIAKALMLKRDTTGTEILCSTSGTCTS